MRLHLTVQPRIVSNSQSPCFSLSSTAIVGVCQDAGFWELVLWLSTQVPEGVCKQTLYVCCRGRNGSRFGSGMLVSLSSLWPCVHFNMLRIPRIQNKALNLLYWINSVWHSDRGPPIARVYPLPTLWGRTVLWGLVFCFAWARAHACMFSYVCAMSQLISTMHPFFKKVLY